MFYDRILHDRLVARLLRPTVEILFGARQTGKTALLREILEPSLSYNFADPVERTRLLADPGAFRRECEALPRSDTTDVVFVDEAQLVPSVFDSVQVLFDGDRTRWKFVLCGSSARKLRQAGTNLLPGRAVLHSLHPLTLYERPSNSAPEPGLILPLNWAPNPAFPLAGLAERLAFGELPGIAALDEQERCLILRSYVDIHLQEEIRREGLVRDWGAFVNFVRLAALEAGKLVNYSRISNETGVSVPTIKSHYQLLQDMFVGFTVPGFSGSPRKGLLSTPRFFFFDLGVRHAAAGMRPGAVAVQAAPGPVFEQWVGAELYRRLRYLGEGTLSYLRTKGGAEIDYILDYQDQLVPIEVKWTEHPTVRDTRHLRRFLDEQARAERAFVVCRCPHPQQLTERIQAIPWDRV